MPLPVLLPEWSAAETIEAGALLGRDPRTRGTTRGTTAVDEHQKGVTRIA